MGFERLTARASIVLPIGDADWVIESPDAATGALVNALFDRTGRADREGRDLDTDDVSDLVLDDDQQRELFPRVLGDDTYAEMTAPGSGLTWDQVQHAATTTMVWIVSGLDVAVAFFNSGGIAGDPPVAPNRAARRSTSTKPKVVPARPVRRVSTAGTTKAAKKVAAAAPVSRGRSSARTGT